MKDRDRRRRVSADTVRRRAKEGGGGRKWFTLPKGVREWAPDKDGSYLIDVLPYEVDCEDHPDKVDKGVLWYRREFKVHRSVGPNNERLICPTSIGKRCPICEERAKLAKNWDDNEDVIKTMNFQKFVVFNIVDPDDEDAVAIFCMSRGKFAEALDKELAEGDDDIQLFFDVTDKGKTLKVRFSEEKFEGRKYLAASRIDFKDREAMDEDEVLGKVVCLDTCLEVLSYDRLKAMFFQTEDGDGEGAPAPDEDASGDDEPKGKQGKQKEDPEEPEGNEDQPEWKKGDSVQFKDGKKTIIGKIKKIKGDEAVVANDDDEYEVDLDDLESVSEPEQESEPEGDTGDGDEPKKVFKEGDNVTLDDGKFSAVVVKMHKSGKKVLVKDEDDDEDWYPVEDVELAKGKKGKAKEKEDKDDDEPPAKGKCPHGHKFAVDCDKYEKDCEDCKVWEDCDAAHEKLKKEKGKK